MTVNSRRLRAAFGAFVGATMLSVGAVSVAQPAVADEVSPDVVGGERASIADHPWTVYLSTPSGFQYCGGTLVAPNKVVTAAHCTVGDDPADVRVVAGREDKQSSDGTVAGVTDIWIHPDYVTVTRGEDVSVLTLDQSLPYGTLPFASPDDSALYAPGIEATVLGWGNTSEGGSASRYLMRAGVPVTTDEYCGNGYSRYDPTSMVCAGFVQGGTDTCQGDSGGPMVAGGKLIGITSWGSGCARAGLPGVYARVSTYHDLIAQQVGA